MKRRYFRGLALLLCPSFLLAGITAMCVIGAGDWLHNDDELAKANAIVLLGGNPSRAYHAADLYLRGLAPLVCLSAPRRTNAEKLLDQSGIFMPREEEISRQVLVLKGVPEKNIVLLGKEMVSTIDEAEEAMRLVKPDPCRLIVVTSPYHVRRTKMIFTDRMKGCDIRVVGSSYEPYPSKWWQDKELAGNVVLEMHRIVFYQLGGRYRQ
jgi:uncharacterized SAM-binding protein YcdF (DUF218 family)